MRDEPEGKDKGALAPFSAWPIHFRDASVGYAWYAGSGTFVSQFTPARATLRGVNVMNDWLDETLATHRAEIEHAGGLLAIHDWRKLRSYDSQSRELWFARMKARPANYLRKAIVIVGDAPLLKMALAGANLLAALNLKARVELASNPHQVLRAHGVRPPSPVPVRPD